jgi:OmpA-OmpF porin, OOP family
MTSFRSIRWAAAGILCATLGSMASAANAQVTGEGPGFYVSGDLGAVLGGDDKIKGDGIDTDVTHSIGIGAVGAVGIRFDNGLRAEFEVGYRREDTDKSGGVHSSGNTHALNFGPNLLYDIRTGSRFTPYFGLGAGAADVGYRITVPGNGVDGSGIGFAYQGIAGLAYALTDQLQLTADYRYIRALPVNISATAGGTTQANYHAHTVLLGVRWLFYPTSEAAPPRAQRAAAPAQPMMPAPAPAAAPAATAPAASFIVYFDFDSATITSQGAQTIQQAASAIKGQQAARITVTGHTDLTGSEQYNQRLSQRRANAVKAALMRLGVPADSIAVVGKDGENPAVPTPIGVREPKNRSAVIVF